MKVKVIGRKGLVRKIKDFLRQQRQPKRWVILFGFGIALIFIIILSSIFFGMFLHKVGVAEVLNKMKAAKLKIIPNYFKSFIVIPERIAINIKHMDYQKLVYMRETALALKIITSDCKVYVPATIQYKEKVARVDIRLKGDALDHLKRNKWSFRIKMKGDDTLFGMRQFSIQHPKTRSYIYEWISHKALQREGIIVPRYEFVDVTLNGKNWGIYALEEHFEKRLIEDNKHREGPIIKFNEDIKYAEQASVNTRVGKGDSTPFQTSPQKQFAADIDAFGMNKILRTPQLYRQFVLGKDLLESFRRGMLPAHKVFNIEKLARYFAVSELMSAWHGAAVWFNLRFYYNPVTSLLEPIGFDAYTGERIDGLTTLLPESYTKSLPSTFYERIFSDNVFLKEYIRTLERISKRIYLDDLFSEINEDLQRNLNIIYKEFPYFLFSKDVFYQNQRKIQALLNPVKGIHGYFYKAEGNNIELEIGNFLLLPIEVLGVFYEEEVLFPMTEKTILFPKIHTNPIDYKLVRFLFPKDFNWSDSMVADLKVKYKIFGTNQVRYATVFPYSLLSDSSIEDDFIRQPSNVDDFEFLEVDELARKIFIKRGNWDLDRSLIIPKMYEVICREGTTLNITNSARILSYSPLKFFGSAERPITIYSTDSTGQGLIVIKAGEMSVLQDVVFDGLSNPSHGGWELTGAVTFYESDVEIVSCRFSDNRSEDGLNIIRSNFSIDKSFFYKTSFDGLDIDFSKGKITSTSFIDCGNDAIDTSGSYVEMRNIFVNGAGDKGLSVGEASKITVGTAEIRNAKTAMASKDMSELNVNNIKISNCNIGFSVYQKKSEFAPSFLSVAGLKASKIGTLYLVEKDSKLEIDKEEAQSDQDEVKEKLDKGDKI